MSNVSPGNREGAFTIVEAVIAVAVLGIGIASSLTALTKMNSFAGMSRNDTGAYTVLQNQIDAILCNAPFNPQKTNFDGTAQIPPELKIGTTTVTNVPVYKEPSSGIIVPGTMTTTVSDVSTTYYGVTMYMYQATVTVTYTYLNRTYSFSMNTVRCSDI
jgi:type II secretory pathway pseudopilin PulG